MRKILAGLGLFAVLVGFGVLVLPALIPVDAYKAPILAQIRAVTGRDARIAGDLHLSLIPNVEFVASKVSLANAPGQPGDLMTIGKLSIRVGLWQLLHGDVAVHSLVLKKPVIALALDKAGQPNWPFAGALGNAPAAASDLAASFWFLNSLSFGKVRLVDGQVSYTDARTGRHLAADAVEANLSLPSWAGPLQADGAATWRGERVAFALKLAAPDAILACKPTAAEAMLTAPGPTRLSFHGTLTSGKGPKAHGAVTLETPSLSQLAAWAGTPLAWPGNAPGKLKLTATADADGATLVLRDATVSLDAVQAKGEIRLDPTRARPYIAAKLALDRLDLNPYLAPAGGNAGRPLDPAPLRLADADLDLALGPLAVHPIRIDRSHVVAALKAGKIDANVSGMALYGGGGRSHVTVDVTGAVPALAFDAELSGVQVAALLHDVAGGGRLSGTANLTARGTARGATQPAILASLAAAGRFQVRNGTIGGSDLLAMVRNLQGAFDSAARGRQTDFSELGGSYTIRNGILYNNDLDMRSPALRVTGRGTLNLARNYIDFRVEPKLVSPSLGGIVPGGLIGIVVPVFITGPLDNPSFRPDLAGAVGATAKGVLPDVPNIISGGGSIGPIPNPIGIVKGLFDR